MFQGMGRGVVALLNCLPIEVLLISVVFFLNYYLMENHLPKQTLLVNLILESDVLYF